LGRRREGAARSAAAAGIAPMIWICWVMHRREVMRAGSAEEPRLGVWVAEEAGPFVRTRAGEGGLCQVGDVDAEGRGEREATATGWEAECVEGAATAEDQVVARRLAECEVGCFEVEL